MEVTPSGKQRLTAEQPVRSEILSIHSLLQARVMLLDLISELRIVQKESEVRKQIKQRATEEPINLEIAARAQLLLVVDTEHAGTNASAIERIDESKPIQPPGSDFIERNLTG